MRCRSESVGTAGGVCGSGDGGRLLSSFAEFRIGAAERREVTAVYQEAFVGGLRQLTSTFPPTLKYRGLSTALHFGGDDDGLGQGFGGSESVVL